LLTKPHPIGKPQNLKIEDVHSNLELICSSAETVALVCVGSFQRKLTELRWLHIQHGCRLGRKSFKRGDPVCVFLASMGSCLEPAGLAIHTCTSRGTYTSRDIANILNKLSHFVHATLFLPLVFSQYYQFTVVRRMVYVRQELTQTAQNLPWSVSLARPAGRDKALPQPVGVSMTQSVRTVQRNTTPN